MFGDVAVIASSAAWVEKYRPEIERFVCGIGEINHVKWRPSIEILKEEGLEASDFKEVDSSSSSSSHLRTKARTFTINLKRFTLCSVSFVLAFSNPVIAIGEIDSGKRDSLCDIA